MSSPAVSKPNFHTPLMQQYFSIKSEFPDTLLLFSGLLPIALPWDHRSLVQSAIGQAYRAVKELT